MLGHNIVLTTLAVFGGQVVGFTILVLLMLAGEHLKKK